MGPGVASVPGVAWDLASEAQTEEARKAYKAGKALEQQRKYELALSEYRRSYGIVASPNSHYLIVQMLSQLAREKRNPQWLVDAHREAQATLDEATSAAAKNSDKYGATAKNAAIDVADLEKQVPVLVVQVPGSVKDATVSVSGAPVPTARWGKPYAVPAGSVEVVLSLASGLRSTKTVEAKPGARVEVAFVDPTPPKVEAPPPPLVEPPPPVAAEEQPDTATESGRGAFVAGLKFGALASIDGLQPNVTGAVQIGYVLPWLRESFGVMVDVGYAQPVTKDQVADSRVEGGRYSWNLVEQQLTVQPSVYYRLTALPKMGPGKLVPYLGAGPRIYMTRSRTDSTGKADTEPMLLEQREESLEIGLGAHLGSEYTVGPGSLLVEGLFGWTGIDQRTTGNAALSGISAWAGYRFML